MNRSGAVENANVPSSARPISPPTEYLLSPPARACRSEHLAGLPEPDPAAQAPQVALPFRQRADGVDRAAREQREVSRVHRQRQLRQTSAMMRYAR